MIAFALSLALAALRGAAPIPPPLETHAEEYRRCLDEHEDMGAGDAADFCDEEAD